MQAEETVRGPGSVAGERRRVAVLLMAYGGPDALEDVEPYLLDVRDGRPLPPTAVAEIRERYRLIGGRSPILERTREQADALERRLNRGYTPVARQPRPDADEAPDAAFRVYVGMRHWTPTIEHAVQAIGRDGADLGVAIALAPQYSSMSVGAYLRKLEEARRAGGADLEWRFVESWCDHPALAAAFAAKVRAALEPFPQGEREDVVVVFTAHSLPERILSQDDPYPRECRRTIEAVLALLPPIDWRQAWQSQGQTEERWIGPDAGDVMRELAAAGRHGVVIAPVGFLCDHVEILYDVDVQYRRLARELGIRFERTESLNDDPLLIEALTDLVLERVDSALGSRGDAPRPDSTLAARGDPPRPRQAAAS